jgi:hypothetical protein
MKSCSTQTPRYFPDMRSLPDSNSSPLNRSSRRRLLFDIPSLIGQTQIRRPRNPHRTHKRDLKLNRHHPEIHHLHRRPEYEIGPQRRDVDVCEFLFYFGPTTTFRQRHEGEEAGEATGGEHQLVDGDALKCREEGPGSGYWEGSVEEAVPLVLDWRHQETV